MDDFSSLEKTIVRELSCRLCLCTDVMKLKPLSAEIKRKIKKLFDIVVRSDDTLPKAICHECLQHVSHLYLYAVKVEKTQKFLTFHKSKVNEEKQEKILETKPHSILAGLSSHNVKHDIDKCTLKSTEHHHGDSTTFGNPSKLKMKFMEAMSLEEFATAEKVDKSLLNTRGKSRQNLVATDPKNKISENEQQLDSTNDTLDSIVLIDGRPAKHGAALDKQITLFYKMECNICHELGFHFRSLMRHYKDRHGVPGYVTCCDKKFHYFYPKKIIEHMAYHLQSNIFMCPSCHQNFQTSQELAEHQTNGGRSEGKIICPRCGEKYPTYRELGWHIITHREADKPQCDFCGKLLKHHHRKKTINRMEDVILCSQCIRTLRTIEKQEKEIKEKTKSKSNDKITLQKHQKFRQALGLSGDEDASTE